ncbi:MAG TPA: acetate--CoA ligase family protein [Steroidobacteraceae bacterium]|jgi:acyl-CoA synthetase (NDP forming)
MGKQVLAALGIRTPKSRLATSAADAAAVAAEIGYPAVMKAQAAQLTHKSEAGGVLLGIANDIQLTTGWNTLHANVARHRSDLLLDGILVEEMGARCVASATSGQKASAKMRDFELLRTPRRRSEVNEQTRTSTIYGRAEA